MTELSEESRALLEAEGPLDEPTAAELDAMHERVVAALGPLALPQPPAPNPTPLAGKAAATGSLKLIGGAVAAAVGSSALLFALNQPAREKPVAPPPASVVAPRPAAVAPPPVTSVIPEPEPEASAPPASARPPRSAKSAAPSATVATSASEEALLVATAEAQLRAGHPAAALALYDRHLRDYPKGALRQEVTTGRVVALCGVGRSAEVRSYVASFAASFPGSASALRMQRACGMAP